MPFSEFDQEKIKGSLRGIISNAEELERWLTEECGETGHPALDFLDHVRGSALRAGEKLNYTERDLTEVKF